MPTRVVLKAGVAGRSAHRSLLEKHVTAVLVAERALATRAEALVVPALAQTPCHLPARVRVLLAPFASSAMPSRLPVLCEVNEKSRRDPYVGVLKMLEAHHAVKHEKPCKQVPVQAIALQEPLLVGQWDGLAHLTLVSSLH